MPVRSRRLLLVLLDTRPRWWLSLWLWVPICVVLFWASAQVSHAPSVWISRDRLVFYQYDDQFVAAEAPRAAAPDRESFVTYWDVSTEVMVMERFDRVGAFVVLNISDRSGRPSTQDAAAAIGRVMSELDGWADPSWHLDSTEDRVWASEKIRELLRSGDIEAWRSRGLLRSAAATAAHVGTPLAPTLLLVACILWFVRASQLVAYRRVLRSLEAGRCPKCSYDVTGTSESRCPECGCNLQARAREAQRVLAQAGVAE